MDLFIILVAVVLVLFSIIDWHVRAIPSLFLTATLFIIAVLNPANLFFGLMALLMAWLLYEADFFSGMADIKIMAMIGFMIPTTWFLLLYIALVCILGFVWKLIIKWRMKSEKETAFIPVFLFVYLSMYALGGLAV